MNLSSSSVKRYLNIKLGIKILQLKTCTVSIFYRYQAEIKLLHMQIFNMYWLIHTKICKLLPYPVTILWCYSWKKELLISKEICISFPVIVCKDRLKLVVSVLLSCFCTEIQDQCEKAADSSDAEYDDDFEEYDSSEVSTPTPIKSIGAPFYKN